MNCPSFIAHSVPLLRGVKRVSWLLLFCAVLPTTQLLAQMPFEACAGTSDAAERSCLNETREEFWAGIGNCRNMPTPVDRRDCWFEVRDGRDEAEVECADQFDAREEVCDLIGESAYDPQIDPANFVDPADIGTTVNPNPYWPLVPGTIWTYEGGDETITVEVTGETVELLGVTCAVVNDLVEEDGEPIEDTADWYAQDLEGNVWYFGELSLEFEDGQLVGLEGSWKSGVDGAKPGIVMKAEPMIDDTYRQEFLLLEAEDMATVLSLNADAASTAASCTGDCLQTFEFTPIEPDVAEEKFYKAGIGLIREVDTETGEFVALVEFTVPE